MKRHPKPGEGAGRPPTTGPVVIRLYIAGGAPNSVRAIANLGSICDEYLKGNYELEIIDILQQPLRALVDGVLITPTLAKVSPQPATRVVGNLSEKSDVLRALGLTEKRDEI